ncbi:MAG: MbnP family copper-binding protein [Acidobacteriota bacterium]
MHKNIARRLTLRMWMVATPMLMLVACGGPAPEPIELHFDALVVDQPARCGVPFEGVGLGATPVEIADARFYVSGFTLTRADGTEVPLELDQDSPWQHENVALLDFEDATGRCSNTGTSQMNSIVRGTVPAGEYTGLSFTIGVPHELNHLDAPTAPSPLNLNTLYWNWRFGYIYTKVEFWNPNVASTDAPAAASVDPSDKSTVAGTGMPPGPAPQPTVTYLAHLGSTGCESSAPTTPPDVPCSRPNRVPVSLADFDPTTDRIGLNLAGLVTGIDVTKSVLRPPGCMSAPIDPDCDAVFANLGIDLETGTCTTDCSDQQLVSRLEGSN